MAVWEGSGNVIALDTVRAITREAGVFDAFDAEVSLAAGGDAVLDGHLERIRDAVLSLGRLDADGAALQARRLTEDLALALQASLLVRYAPSAVADAFVRSRLGPSRAWQYGNLSVSADLGGILERA